MKHWCMVMTLRLSSSRRSGSRQIHRGRKRRVKFAAMSSPCWSFFPDIQGIVHKEFVKPSMASFNVRFWSGWGRAFGTNVQTSGRKTIGFSNMTTRPLAHHSLFDNSWLPKTLQWFSTPTPIRLTWPPATFSYSPRWNYDWRGVVLARLRRSTQKRKRLSTHSHLRTSTDARNHGKHAGIAVCMPKGSTSKETMETRSYGKKLFLWSNSPNFWVAPRIPSPLPSFWMVTFLALYLYNKATSFPKSLKVPPQCHFLPTYNHAWCKPSLINNCHGSLQPLSLDDVNLLTRNQFRLLHFQWCHELYTHIYLQYLLT